MHGTLHWKKINSRLKTSHQYLKVGKGQRDVKRYGCGQRGHVKTQCKKKPCVISKESNHSEQECFLKGIVRNLIISQKSVFSKTVMKSKMEIRKFNFLQVGAIK